jgi:hypothetical protein
MPNNSRQPIASHNSTSPQNRREQLENEKRQLSQRYKKRNRYNKVYLITGFLMLVTSPIVYFYFSNNPLVIVYLISYGALLIIFPLMWPAKDIEIIIRDIDNELDLLEISETSREQRAEKLFKLHQIELKKYYDQTLSHSSWIFFTGILCLLFGFSIIGITIYFVNSNFANSVISEKIVTASLGAIGGLLANFIAVIYLKMHSETIKSLTEFHNRLVLTHHLHFGNFLVAKITNIKLREKTLAQITLNLTHQK